MKYLIKTVETYRVASEEEAKQVIEAAKRDREYVLSKYSSEYKCTKVKGEIADEWYRVTLTKEFNKEKEPDTYVDINYSVDRGSFPETRDREFEESNSDDEEEGLNF